MDNFKEADSETRKNDQSSQVSTSEWLNCSLGLLSSALNKSTDFNGILHTYKLIQLLQGALGDTTRLPPATPEGHGAPMGHLCPACMGGWLK